MHTCVHTHAGRHASMHANMHACTNACSHSLSGILSLSLSLSFSLSLSHTHTHARTRTRAPAISYLLLSLFRSCHLLSVSGKRDHCLPPGCNRGLWIVWIVSQSAEWIRWWWTGGYCLLSSGRCSLSVHHCCCMCIQGCWKDAHKQ